MTKYVDGMGADSSFRVCFVITVFDLTTTAAVGLARLCGKLWQWLWVWVSQTVSEWPLDICQIGVVCLFVSDKSIAMQCKWCSDTGKSYVVADFMVCYQKGREIPPVVSPRVCMDGWFIQENPRVTSQVAWLITTPRCCAICCKMSVIFGYSAIFA